MHIVHKTKAGLNIKFEMFDMEDIQALFALYQQTILNGDRWLNALRPVTMESFEDNWLTNKSQVIVARLADGEVIGSYWFCPAFIDRGADIAVSSYMVTDSLSNADIEPLFIAHTLDAVKSLGFKSLLYNDVLSSSEVVQQLENQGFIQVSKIPLTLTERYLCAFHRLV